MVEFAFWHGLISWEVYNNFERTCPHLPDELYPEESQIINNFEDFRPRNVTKKCNEYRTQISKNLNYLDIYGIYRICPWNEKINNEKEAYYSYRNTIKRNLIKQRNQNMNKLYKKYNLKINNLKDIETNVWPDVGCGDDLFLDQLLNKNKAKLKVFNESITWTQCSGINYEMGDSLDFYKEIMPKFPDVQFWVFSGTEDGVLSTIGTLRWIEKLGSEIESPWSQWKTNGQVSGYDIKYKNGLALVTIKGAGHMVPQDQRVSAFHMISSFLNGTLPSKNK